MNPKPLHGSAEVGEAPPREKARVLDDTEVDEMEKEGRRLADEATTQQS